MQVDPDGVAVADRAMRGDRGVGFGFVALLRRPAGPPTLPARERRFLASRLARLGSFQCRDVLDARVREHDTSPSRRPIVCCVASAWLFGYVALRRTIVYATSNHVGHNVRGMVQRRQTGSMRDIFSRGRDPPTAFNPAAARMSEVALVDPIALSKDRKKAPLSAPS
jgi:hypothetical protein